ncbi:MAG: hypothetical protein IT350_05940 [Deltaproteobacteria bacterium]|nr:hypothetical protein [Deltaproteobacteria bacterium]
MTRETFSPRVAAAVALAICAVCATGAAAFETDMAFGGQMGIAVGYAGLDLSGVSDYLEPIGTDAFDDGYLCAGGELRGFVFQRLTFGFSGFALRDEASGPRVDADLIGNTFFFDAGFVAVDFHGLRLYPVLGVGATSLTIDLEGDYTALPLARQAGLRYVNLGPRESDGTVTLAENQDVRLDYYAFSGMAALHLDWFFPFVGEPNAYAMAFTGLRVGVIGDIASSGWRIEGRDLDGDNPDFAFNAFFAQVIVGFGGGTNWAP